MRLPDLSAKLLVLILLLGLTTPSLAANYTVTNTNDSGAGSLRQAILDANASSSNDTITFAVNGTINLTSTLTIANNGTLSITGNGAVNTALSGQDTVQVLYINSGANLTLEGVTITRGRAAIGSGIFNYFGTLTISNSALSNNSATISGGIFNYFGTLTISNSTVSGNSATGSGIVNNSGTLTVSNSTFSNNSATSSGGSIANYSGTLTVSTSTFSSNSATDYGGGIYNTGTLTVSTSTFSTNSATSGLGGGIYNTGTLTVSTSTFSDNSATTGGGISNYSGTLTVSNSTFSDNSATTGGGGISNAGTLTVSNSTLSGNSTPNYGGGISNTGMLTINNSIIANSPSGGDCYYFSGTINAQYSLIEDGLTCVDGINNNNLTGDPLLNADLTLQAGSPATDTGDNSLIPSGITTDLAGNRRIQNGTVDMGAYELNVPLLTLSPATVSVAEGNSTTFTLARDGSTTNALTVNLAITLGTGTTSGDYTLSGGSLSAQSGSATVTIPAGSASVVLTLAATDDAIIENAETLTLALVDDTGYDLGSPNSATATIADNDTAGITVTPTSGLTTSEASGTASFTVVLTSQPTADVVIALSSSNINEGTVSPTSLTFTSANWNSAQTVTVTGVDDAVVDGNVGYTIVLAAATSSDAHYSGFDPADVSVTNTDNDTAGITVSPTSGLTTTEAGATATFTVVLTSQPTADVLIALSSSNINEGTVSPANLTFTNANWNTPQTVTVTGVDDAVDDGNVSHSIVLAAATSSDANYNGVNPTDVSVTNTDNDTAGITVTPTSGLTTTEAGATATFTVVLTSQPTADVLIALSSSNTNEGTVSPASLTFTSANWNTAQTVTVTGVDDALVDGDIGYTIILAAATSSDAHYSGFDPADVSVTNTDNDTAGITVSPTSGLTTSEAGATATFTVVLTSQPSADVVIALSSSNTSEGTVSPTSLTFTSANWNTAQTVTVTGVDDAVVDGNVGYTIVLAAATSSDAHYSGFDPADVSVTNTDNDTAGITVTPTSGLTTSEAGGTASFTVVLTSQPSADVLIALNSSNTSEGTVSPASLTFTSANWNTPQTVTVTGVDDALVDGAIGYSITLAVDANSDPTYVALTPSNVSVTNNDNDSATGIPTLSEWALLLLATLMLGIGAHTVTQRRI